MHKSRLEHNARINEWRRKNPDKQRAIKRRWYHKHKETIMRPENLEGLYVSGAISC